jgi:hypothetical protein
MNRKLDVGATLGEVFSIYRAQAGVLLPIAFWLYLLVAVVSVLVGKNLALLPIEVAVTTIAATLYQGVVVSLVRDVQDGRRDSAAGDLLRSAMPVVLPLIGAGFLSGLAIAAGFFLLLVPGLILLTIWAVIAPVIVVERSGVRRSFGRSRKLVRGHGWPVFGVIIVAFLIAIVGALTFGAIAAGISNGILVRIVFTAIASTITAPITALAAAVLYFRLLALGGAAGPPATDPGIGRAPLAPPAD